MDTTEIILEMQALFKLGDRDGNGVLDPAEFRMLLSRCGFEFAPAVVDAIAMAADTNHDGLIEVSEFIPAMLSVMAGFYPEAEPKAPQASRIDWVKEAAEKRNAMVKAAAQQETVRGVVQEQMHKYLPKYEDVTATPAATQEELQPAVMVSHAPTLSQKLQRLKSTKVLGPFACDYGRWAPQATPTGCPLVKRSSPLTYTVNKDPEQPGDRPWWY